MIPNRLIVSLVPRNCLLTLLRKKGHSKWDNIRHTKMSKDLQRSQLISKVVSSIRLAVWVGGGSTDPKVNTKLASAIEAARQAEVPSATIERNLKKLAERSAKPIISEVIGPGGVFIIIDGETDNPSGFRIELKRTLGPWKKDISFARNGALTSHFMERGVVRISRKTKDGSDIDFDQAEMIAIEAEAEEVVADQEGEETPGEKGDEDDTWDLMCNKDDLYFVKDHIEKRRPDVVIKEFCIERFPNRYIELKNEELEKLADISQALESLPDVSKVYVNVK
ncbi:putative transcriptional regulatory protein PERMA_0079 [Brevipalpus obovatus]|uniref:putative transcriptional regulatory protein PERMA_0079 n=1 Tax=Brevipalpus obovatus TaxID=246614 RepID=UPI003D9E0937